MRGLSPGISRRVQKKRIVGMFGRLASPASRTVLRSGAGGVGKTQQRPGTWSRAAQEGLSMSHM